MDFSTDSQSRISNSPPKLTTLRRPVQIIKKRSGPLDEALTELNKSENETYTKTPAKKVPSVVAETSSTTADKHFVPQVKTANVTRPSPTSTRRRSTLKDKEKKRERWLLTRKTWKYMTDAGRKLLPDGVQNRQEDIPKIEAHFQKVCAAEPHFVLWRRKSSYPGAMRNSKKRLKQLLQHTGHKSQQILEQEEVNNADIVLELLHSHLKLDETIKTDTLLGAKTEGPHQTNSPSAQRPKPLTKKRGDTMSLSLRGPGFLSQPATNLHQLSEVDQLLQRLLTLSRSAVLPTDVINISPDKINAELLNDKATLKRIYTALKKQQLHRILSKHSMPSKPHTNLTHSSSMLSLLHFGSSYPKTRSTTDTATEKSIKASPIASLTSFNPVTASITHIKNSESSIYPTTPQRQRKPPTSLNLSGNLNSSSSLSKNQSQQRRRIVSEKQLNSCSTQTNFIPLNEIKRLAEVYKEYKRNELADGAAAGGGYTTTDDESEKQASSYTYHRKSSIDNEDVSQSVSDTIKRYLRMARKKSVHDDNANRFKRVNYDRNLRNIQAKGEINPPGMDEDNNKAVQTLDAWALITLDFIRGNENSGLLETAHNEWQKALDERIQRKLEYEQKMTQKNVLQQPQPSTSSCSSSAPTSPTSIKSPSMANRTSISSSGSTFDMRPITAVGQLNVGVGSTCSLVNKDAENISNASGLFHSSSQFIANLWHGTIPSSNSSSPTLAANVATAASNANHLKHEQLSPSSAVNDDAVIASNNSPDMQKSKSLSHIGQYVSTKILKSHSKNQTKSTESSPVNPIKVPKWSRAGKLTWISETGERILLRDTAFHNLSELEAKMVQKICIEKIIELNIGIDLSALSEGKSHKRRLLAKKRAMTTSFFDIGKKEFNDHSIILFGNSLEGCVLNDKKREMSNMNASSDRGSRNSIVSLFRVASGGSVKNSISSHKLNENVRSCESLPTGAGNANENVDNKTNTKYTTISNYFGNMAKSASRQLSRSQTDVRRSSNDNTELNNLIHDNEDVVEVQLQVPRFVTCCIHYLEEHGLHKVGIFRVSTSKKRVKQLRDSFDKNNDKCFDEDTCPHNVATLLKEFLRDLSEPLLSNFLYNAFLETQKIRNRRLQLEAISHLVKLLPPAHRDTLYVLLKFLAKVAACSDDTSNNDGTVHLTGNKMDSNNLATVFAPNILRSTVNYQSSSRSQVQSREQDSISDTINVIRIMIDHYEELFRVSADVLDVVFLQLLDEAPEQLNHICEHHKTTMRNCIQFY